LNITTRTEGIPDGHKQVLLSGCFLIFSCFFEQKITCKALKEILQDFREIEFATGVPRRLQIETVVNKATVCIGVRRSGKPTYLFQIIERLQASGILVNFGHLLENLVFIALRRVSAEIYYCKSNSGLEVDFIVLRPGQGKMLVQVCESLVESRTRKREVTALSEVMTGLALDAAIIVTLNEEMNIEVEAGTIAVVPIWRFLLSL